MINEANVSSENIYGFLKEKIDELQESAVDAFEKTKEAEELSEFIESVINDFSEKGNEILSRPDNYLTGGLLFYEKLASLLDDKIQGVNESISKIEKELFEGTNQKSLNLLLDKLEAVTKKKNTVGEFVVKMGQSATVALVNQIIDTAAKIQQQKKDKYNHLLLQYVHNSLAIFFYTL